LGVSTPSVGTGKENIVLIVNPESKIKHGWGGGIAGDSMRVQGVPDHRPEARRIQKLPFDPFQKEKRKEEFDDSVGNKQKLLTYRTMKKKKNQENRLLNRHSRGQENYENGGR